MNLLTEKLTSNKKMNEELKAMIAELVGKSGYATSAEVKAITDKMAEMKFATPEQVEVLDTALNQLNEKMSKMGKEDKEKVEDLFLKGIESAYEGFKNGQGKEIQVKAGEGVLTGVTNQTLSLQVESGVAKPAKRNYVRNFLNTVMTSAGSIGWIERKTHTNNAEKKTENAAVTASQTTWEQKKKDMAVIAAMQKFSDEFESDLPMILADLKDDLGTDVEEKLDEFIVNDTTGGLMSVGTALKIGTTDPFGKAIPNANVLDVIAVAYNQAALKNYVLDTIFMNPTDITSMKLTKNNDGSYIMPVFYSGGLEISGMRVIPSTTVAADKFFAIDSTKVKLYVNWNLALKIYDQNSDDAEKGMKTAIAKVRSLIRVREHEKEAVVTCVSIKAAVTAFTKAAA